MNRQKIFATFLLILIAIASSPLLAQQNKKPLEDKILTKLNQKQLDNAIEKWTGKGFVPFEADVTVQRNRPSFSLKLLKPRAELKFVMRTSLTDDEFKDLNEKSKAKKYGLVCHREFTVEGNSLHLCIWHFDESIEPEKDRGKLGETPTPKPVPLPQIWNSAIKIPISGKPVPAFAELESFVLRAVRSGQIPGASVAVAFNGRVLYARGFGFSDLATKTTLKPDQPMRLFQLSRPITAAAIVQLIDRGRINLTDPVFELLDHKATNPSTVDPNLKNITIGNLLYDMAGFDPKSTPDPIRSPRGFCTRMNIDLPVTQDQIIRQMMSQPLDYEPGTKRVESDFGYCLLGRVIERVSRMSYEEYVQKNIFKPLRMKTFSLAKTLKDERAKKEASYYSRTGGFMTQIARADLLNKWVPIPDGIHMELFDSSGGWIGTPAEFLVFASAVHTPNSPLMSPAAAKAIFEKPANLPEARTGGQKPRYFYGAGWKVSNTEKRGMTYHWGGHTGSSALVFNEANGLSWCIIANCYSTADKKAVVSAFSYTETRDAIIKAKKNLGL